MADPFSVTGSAVGVVSLSIQVCKGLIWYIDSAKDAKDRVSEIQNRMDMLADLLENLETVIQKLDPNQSTAATQAVVFACTSALEKIKKKLPDPTGAGGSKVRWQMHSLAQRLSFPFKQSDIMYYKDLMESIQQNLNTALIILNIEQSRLDAESIKLQIAQQSALDERSIETEQQRLHERTSLQLSDQLCLVRSGLRLSSEQHAVLQTDIQHVQDSLSPMVTGISKLSDDLPAMVASMARLEAKIDTLTPRGISPKAIEENLADLKDVGGDLRHINRKSVSRRQMPSPCGCREVQDTTVYLQWPIRLTRTLKRLHHAYCPHAAFEDAVTDLNLRFSVCSSALKRKAQVVFALSYGAGSASIVPGLTSYKIVKLEESPAFEILAKFEYRLGLNPSLDAWEKSARDLYELFQSKAASPHDRLANGQTLLNFFCSNLPRYTSRGGIANHVSMAKRLLAYMPSGFDECDDQGRTCTDHCVWSRKYTDLTEALLCHGIPINIMRSMNSTSWCLGLYMISFRRHEESLVDCPEHIKAFLLKDERRLQQLLRKKDSFDMIQEDSSMYGLATLGGWRRGCELLYQHGVKILGAHSRFPLLYKSCMFGSLDVLRFWLEVRPNLDRNSLDQVGSLEGALWYGDGHESRDAIISAMVQQRRDLASIALANLSTYDYIPTAGKLLDSKARHVFNTLSSYGVNVQPALQPSTHNIYYQSWPDPVILDALYQAGFRDVTAADSPGHLSPLLFTLTSKTTDRAEEVLEIIDWYLSKGADLRDCWPGSAVTVLHCLGWSMGNSEWYSSEYFYQVTDRVSPLFTNTCVDSCKCACSTAGCLFLTSICKALITQEYFVWESEDVGLTYKLKAMAGWVVDATINSDGTERAETRWLVTEFFRIATVWRLGIRHTCCDLSRIQHDGDPPLHVSPTPRYTTAERKRIEEEDRYLVDLLEQLIVELEEEYDRLGENVYWFSLKYMRPRLEEELRKLKKEDKEMFSQGRRELGVVMEVGSSDDEEEDEEEDEDEESDI